jgi:hypothetical protein
MVWWASKSDSLEGWLGAATDVHASPEPLVVGFVLTAALRIVTTPIRPNDAAAVTAFEISGAVLKKIHIGVNCGF